MLAVWIGYFHSGKPDAKVTIQGWVGTKRELKEFAFVEVNHGSSKAVYLVGAP